MGGNNTIDQSGSNTGVQFIRGESDLTLYEIVQVIIRYRNIAIGIALSFLIGSIVYAVTATPIYRAEITLAPARGAPTGGLSSLMSSFGGALGGLASMAGMMGMGTQGSRLIRGEASLALTSTGHIQGFIAANNLLPVLFEDLWDPENKEWLVNSDEDIPTLSDGYDRFVELIEQNEDLTTGIVVLAIEWKDPGLAADWANNLVGSLNARLRAKTIRDTDKTIDFLTQELERTKITALRQSIYYMIEQNIGSKTTARVQDEFAFKIINPALVPDQDKYVHPKRFYIIFIGTLVGIVAGVLGTFFAYAISQLRKEYTSG